MTRLTPQWLQNGNYPASADRRLIGAIWPRGMVSGMATTAGAGMAVNVAAGQAAVPTPNNTGTTLCTSDASESVTIPTAPASGLNRIDIVTVHPRGNDLDGGSNDDWIFDVISGVAAATPVAPAVPAGQLQVAQVTVPGGAGSIVAGNITDVRQIVGLRPWYCAWGRVPGATAQKTDVQSVVNTTADLAGLSITWTPIPNRLYELEMSGPFFANVAGLITFFITDSGNVTVSGASQTVGGPNPASQITGRARSMPVSFAGGAAIVHKCRMTSTSADQRNNNSATSPTIFSITDIGPVPGT